MTTIVCNFPPSLRLACGRAGEWVGYIITEEEPTGSGNWQLSGKIRTLHCNPCIRCPTRVALVDAK